MPPYIRLRPGVDVMGLLGQAAPADASPSADIFMTDDPAPIVRRRPDGRLEMIEARWGVPFIDVGALARRRWPGPRNRCIVPFSAFGVLEVGAARSLGRDVFAPLRGRVGFLAGVCRPDGRRVRSMGGDSEGLDVFGLVSGEGAAAVGPFGHAPAPLLLVDAEEARLWLTAPWTIVKNLGRRRPIALAPAEI